MNGNDRNGTNRERFVDALAAELTEAAYVVALRHEKPESWIDLELDLWKALGETVQKWVPQGVGQREAAYIDLRGEDHRRYASC